MFGTIRKHQTWLWIVISGATIVSFVYFFTPGAGRSGRAIAGDGNYGTINGRAISRREYTDAWLEAQIGLFLRSGTWPDRSELQRSGSSLETETRNRLVLLDRISELNIQVGVEAIGEWVAQSFGEGRQPGTARAVYDNLVHTVLPRYGVGEADLQRFIKHQVGISHLLTVVGTAGKLTPPREAASQFRQENEKIESAAVVFAASNYLAAVTVEPAALDQFYTNNRSTYRVPERVQVNYVRFASTNFLAEADATLAKTTNLAQEIDRIYLGRSAGSFVDTNGQVLPPDAARQRIKDQLREQQSLVAARKAAAGFATELEAIKPRKTENLMNLAAAKNLVPGLTEAFSELRGPTNLNVNEKFVEAAFRLTPTDPISKPIVGRDSIYLLSLKDRIPSAVPPLEAIRGQVVEEYKLEQARRLAREAATNFVRLLTNGLAQGRTFDTVCSGASVTPIPIPKFALATRTVMDLDRHLNLEQLKTAVAGKNAGQASDVVPTRDGAFVAWVKTRTPVTDGELKTELPKFLADLQQSEQMQAFNEWFRVQVETSRINTLKGRDETSTSPE